MFKILRKKVQSLTENQQNILTVVLVLINIGIVIFWISFFVSLPKPTPPKIEEKPPLVEEIPEALKPGEVGEIKVKEETGEEKPLVTPTLPLTIFSTTGVISEVKDDRLIVKGDGFSFADQKPRELIVIFTDSTITFEEEQKTKYQGLAGLRYLRTGIGILIGSEENIRGKTEFKAKTINIF